MHAVFECAVARFGGLFQTGPTTVELPAVIRAAQSVRFGNAVRQRSSAMRAALRYQAHVACFGAIQRQVFAEHRHRLDGFGNKLRQRRDGMPVPPQEGAHRRAQPNLCQPFICFSGQHRGPLSCAAR